MTAPVYRAWTKAKLGGNGPPKYEAGWATSRRGWLKVFPDRLECGPNVIKVDDVQDAVLYEARQAFIPVYVLAVATPDGTWQFGLNPWTNIGPHLPFPFRRQSVRLRYSLFSVAVRLAAVAYIAYVIYRRTRGP